MSIKHLLFYIALYTFFILPALVLVYWLLYLEMTEPILP